MLSLKDYANIFMIKNKKQKLIELPKQPNAFIFACSINQRKK